MTVEHINRNGDTYYLIAGRTKTGKPRYHFARKQSGASVDRIPDGFEIYENPKSAQVYLRKKKPTEITAMEREMVAEGIRRYAGLEHFIVEIEDNGLVVYMPGMSEAEATRLTSLLCSPLAASSARAQNAKGDLIRRSAYSEMFRFGLVDADKRLYNVMRWCFRGSVDDWIHIDGPAPLPALVREYAPHLGRESFFELM